MPRLIPKPNGNPLPNKPSHKHRQTQTLGHIDKAVSTPRSTLLNELLSSLMIPLRMTDGGDQEAPLQEHRFIDDDYHAHQMQRPPHAVSYDEDALRDRSDEPTTPRVDGASGAAGEPVLLQRDDERSAFASDSYQQSQDRHGQNDRDRNYSSSMSPMPIDAIPAAHTDDRSAAAASQNNPQFEQGTPRHPNYPRSQQENTNTPVNPFPYPPQHHYRYHPQHQHPYPYDYSAYYHHHSSEGDIAGASPYHHHVWPPEQPHGFQNYSSPYQDYSYHAYYSSSSPASYPPQHPPSHRRHVQQYPEDTYSSLNHVPSRSRHPHSAPPSYHRSAYATSLRTTPPLPSTREAKHPTPQHYKETPSAITEGTTPSKQSPTLELSPEMSALFDESGSEHEEDRKPAAKQKEDSQTRTYESRKEHGESSYMGVMNDESPPRNDDFEPIPFWSDLPRGAVSSSEFSRYRIYPPAASARPDEYPPPIYAVDPQQHGLAPQHRYPSTPTRSAAIAPVSSRQDSMASTLSSGGEGSSWEKRFAELLEFRTKFGHCEVPQNYKDNTSLGIWVNKQRMEQKNRMEGKNSSLNDSRMQRLESVGFRWAKRKGQVSWNEKFEELKAYKKKHGNCHVPTKYKANTALGRWVSTQRAEYKKFCEGDEKSSMTTEKIRRLEEIGFAWFMAL